MPSERTTYTGAFVRESDGARLLALHKDLLDDAHWIPKSVFTYYSNDGKGCVKFSVERWKERDIEAAGFSEA